MLIEAVVVAAMAPLVGSHRRGRTLEASITPTLKLIARVFPPWTGRAAIDFPPPTAGDAGEGPLAGLHGSARGPGLSPPR